MFPCINLTDSFPVSFPLESSVDIKMAGLMLFSIFVPCAPIVPKHSQVEKSLREGTSAVII